MRDLAELLDPSLRIPIAGVEYRVDCSAWHGLHLHHLLASKPNLSDDQERAEIIDTLGDAYERMLADGVSWEKIVHAGRTAMFWFGHSRTAGQRYWESGGVTGNPLPPSPNQKRMGERLRSIFQRPERTDLMIRAAANTTP